jgi:uncharacterized protein YlzI (FlbEa/FlbD family)
MKKITTILMLLMLTCMGAKADVVTTWTTAGSIVTKDALVASAGTGARYAFRMPSNTQPGWCGFNSTTGKVDILDVDHLFTIENGTGDAEGKFWLKRYSNGEYLTGNNEFSATPTIGLTLTDRTPDNVTDYDTGYSNSTPFVSFDNDEGKHYNNGNSNYDFRGGTGGWSVYVTYGPFYIVTVDCQEGGTSMDGYPQTLIVTENTTIEAPEFVGKAVQGTDSYTISEDQNITFNYGAASSFDYTLVVNGAPEGTTIKIKDETVSAGAVSFDSQVTESDIVVTFPDGAAYTYNVTIDGTTITINCMEDWTVKFADGDKIIVGEKVSSVTAATAGSDNDHWYIVTQVRGGESVLFARGNNEKLRRGTAAQTAASFNSTDALANGANLVRFISAGEDGLYKMQFGNGQFVDASLKPSTNDISNAATYTFYNSNNGEGSYFGWNIDSKAGDIVDNNGAGNDVAFWGKGEVKGTSGNNVWYVYTVSIQDALALIDVTYNLVEAGSSEIIKSETIQQMKESAVSIPATLTSGYYAGAYDFTTTGTIGTEACTITVTATPKEGVVTDLANLSNEKVYTLTSRRGTLSTDATKLTTNTTGADFKNFAIITYDDKKFIWSESDSKWVKKDGTFTDKVADIAESSQMVLTIEGVRNGVKPLYFGGIGDYGINTNAGGHVAMNTWTTRDDGNEFVVKENGDFDPTNLISALDAYFNPSYTINYIVKDEADNTLFTANDVPTTEGATITTLPEAYQRSLFYTYNTVDVTITESVTTIEFTATPKEDAPFEFTADTSAPVWYNLAFTSTPNYVTYVADGAQNVQLPTTLAEDETTQWAFIGNPYDGFQLVNNAAGTDLVLGSGTTTGSSDSGKDVYATLQSKGSQVNEVWIAEASTSISGKNGFFLFNTENHALNKRNGTANISYWVGGEDSGSTFVATKVLSDEEKYNELIALLESYPFGTGTNQYNLTLEGADQTENAKNLLQNLKDAGYSADNQAELDKIVAGMSLNMPKAGFYRIKGQNSGMYLAAGLAENNKFAMTDAVDATTIFCFDGTKLINYSDGMVNGMSASAWAWVYGDGAASEVTFQDGLTKGGYGIKSSTANFYDNGDGSASADRGGNVTINENTNSRYTSWYLEEVPELPVTLSLADDGKYYAVFSAPVAASEVIGASVNGVTVSGNQAVYKEVTGGIPADKGVLLIGDSDEAIVILGEYTGDEIESDLTPITAAESSSTALFLDPESTDPFGFYELTGATGGFTASAPNDGTNTVLELVPNETDGIENIEHGTLNMNNGAIYNLQGQKVNKAQKGVFIQNGKKVVLK